jgi:hypothetical protein
MISNNFLGIQRIKIESSAKVSILKGQSFQIKVSGDDANKVKVTQSDNEIDIQYSEPGSSGRNISIGGNFTGSVISGNRVVFQNVSSGGGKNISIINGEVYINGKRVNESGTVASDSTPPKQPVEIEIQCPDGLDIDCTLTGFGILGTFPEFNQARVTIKGDGEAGLQSRSGKFKISGSGDVNYKSLGGSLKASINGSGDIKASGEFDDVEASINGSGNIVTSGTVNGDYDADICGSGDINHSGQIFGRKTKSISGIGSVKW